MIKHGYLQCLSQRCLRYAFLVLGMVFLIACSHRLEPAPEPMQPAARILLINTDNSIERYQEAEKAFLETIDEPVMTVNLGHRRRPIGYIQDLLNRHRFAAIYCIGAKGLGIIDEINPATPVVYSSLLNWHRFADQQRFHGIASEVPAATQLALFRYLFPDLRRIGVFHSEDNRVWVDNARQTAEQLGLQLQSHEIRGPQWLERSHLLLNEVDALWVISDQATLASRETAEALFEQADQAGRPVFAYHPFFIAMGSVLTISADLPTTGRQAAVMVRSLLVNAKPATAIQHPAGSFVILNLRHSEKYGLKLNEAALDSVDQVITE